MIYRVQLKDLDISLTDVKHRIRNVEYLFLSLAPNYYSVYKKRSEGDQGTVLKERKFIGIYHYQEDVDWFHCEDHLSLKTDTTISDNDYFRLRTLKGTKISGYNEYQPYPDVLIRTYYNARKSSVRVEVETDNDIEQYLLEEAISDYIEKHVIY